MTTVAARTRARALRAVTFASVRVGRACASACTWLVALVAVLWSEPVRAVDDSRDAWVLSTQGSRAALMVGPTTGFIPRRGLNALERVDGFGPLALCTDRGCEAVTARQHVDYGDNLYGVELTIERALTDGPRLADAASIRAAMLDSVRFADVELVNTDRQPPEFWRDSFMGDPREPPTRRQRRRARSARNEGRPARVDWSAPSRWSTEYGAAGGLALVFRDEQPGLYTGFATIRGGFRYQRRPRRSTGVMASLFKALGIATIGNQVGADLRVHYLGRLPEGHGWAVTTRPILANNFPDRRAFLAGRVNTLLGSVGFGVGGVGRDVGLIVQYGVDSSLLVTPHFGLDLGFNLTVNTAGSPTAQLGLGGFFR